MATEQVWTFGDNLITSLDDCPKDAIGFIYEITTASGKRYVGRKSLFSVRKRRFGKKESALITDKRKKLYEMVKKDSGWSSYTGSSADLNRDIKNGMKYKKKILQFAYTKKQLGYLETKELYVREVLESHTNYYNSNIGGKFFPKDINI